MWIEAIIIGIIIGLLRGGRLAYLSNLSLKHLNIFILGVIVQLLPFFFGRFDFIDEWARAIYFVGYLMVFLFLILNISKKGIKFVAFGAALNVITLLLNSFKMPLYVNSITNKMAKMKLSIKTGELVNYMPVEKFDHFSHYLGKIIHMPDFYIGVAAISVADIIITLGIVILIQDAMVSRKGFFV